MGQVAKSLLSAGAGIMGLAGSIANIRGSFKKEMPQDIKLNRAISNVTLARKYSQNTEKGLKEEYKDIWDLRGFDVNKMMGEKSALARVSEMQSKIRSLESFNKNVLAVREQELKRLTAMKEKEKANAKQTSK